MGVKKSTVWTSAISGPNRYTPASSLVSKPTSTFGSVGRGKRRKTESSKLGLSFAAQPAALTMAVSFTGWLKPHLAALRLDYSEVLVFVLAACDLVVRQPQVLRQPSKWIVSECPVRPPVVRSGHPTSHM